MRANPFFGMQVAMTRVDPVITLDPAKYPGSVRPPEAAKLTLEELIKGYTINNAVRLRLEEKMGSLEPVSYTHLQSEKNGRKGSCRNTGKKRGSL